MTRMCVWDCGFCCVDAYFVESRNNQIVLKRNGLRLETSFPRDRNLIFFEDVSDNLQKLGLELTLDDKLTILENVDLDVEFDLSGGDPLLVSDDVEVIRQAAKRLGKEKIEISSTGAGLNQINLEELSQIIGEIGFTYDFSGNFDYTPNRPNAYNCVNLSKVRELKKYGVKATAQIPLFKQNISQNTIDVIFQDLHKSKIDKTVLMKLFNVGRGVHFKTELPSREEYIKAVNRYKKLESLYKTPEVFLQTYLRRTVEGITSENKSLEMISKTLNITNQGMLTLSPWAYDEIGRPLENFVLGDLKLNKLSELYDPLKRDVYLKRLVKK